MRDLARQIVQGSIGIRIKVTHVFLQFSDKATENVMEEIWTQDPLFSFLADLPFSLDDHGALLLL